MYGEALMFAFGTQYFRPPTPKREYWERDFQLMGESGFNIVRLWAMWGWHCPKEGHYNFDELEQLCSLAHKNNLKVIILVNLESSPAWLYGKYAETLYVDRYGRKMVPHTVHNTCCGGFPGHCLDWSAIRDHAKSFISELVKRFASHPALYGWEPHNEPLHEPARYKHEVYCYCDETIKKFVIWLQKKYGTIDNLNQAWQRRFGNFSEVFPPIERGSYADWVDWRLFAIDNLVEHDKWRVNAIREFDPSHPVMIHTRSGSSARNVACDCTDDWRLSTFVDKFGFASFPQGHHFNDHALAGNICRGAAQGKEFWLHELQSGPYGIGLNIPSAANFSGDQLATWVWVSIAQGAKGVLFWQFRTEQFGAEYGFNLVNLDGTANGRMHVASQIAGCIKENEQLFLSLKPKPADVAIGFSPMHPMLNYLAEGTPDNHEDSYLGLHRLLTDMNFHADVVRVDDQIVDDSFNKYKAIFLPLPLWLDAKTAQKLRRYVEQGGLLISEPSLGILEPTFFSSSVVPGMNLHDVFGCHREIMGNEYQKTIPINMNGYAIPSRFLKEIIIPDKAEVIGTYTDGKPAITVNEFGKGKAIYVGSSVFMEYKYNPHVNVCRGFEDILRPWVQPIASVDDHAIVLKMAQAGDQMILFAFNTKNETVKAKITVSDVVQSAEDLYNGITVKFDSEQGKALARLELKPYASHVLKLRKS
jgi:beta-galactosidase